MAQQQLAKQNGNQPIFNPLEKCVVDLTNAMRADFGSKFLKQFAETGVFRQYKRRLYSKLTGIEIQIIYDAYENYVEDLNKWPPTVPELLDAIGKILNHNRAQKKEKEQAGIIQKNSTLPSPKRECNPVEMLKDAKESLSKEKVEHDEWMKRKHLAKLHLDKTVACIPIRYADHKHLCSVETCRKPGSMTSSTQGSEFWYCSEHFAMKA